MFVGKKISQKYVSKIYGGVLGKIIGVRAGIPIEFVTSPAEMCREHPYINTYLPYASQESYKHRDIYASRTIYADDDTNGFVFFAKIFDKINNISDLTPELVAQAILNYAAENRGFFWWGNDIEKSAESEAFHNLINCVSAEESGNYNHIGDLADMIGGQIFYDAVGLIFAGQPQMASYCSGIISSVMHNGEGAYGAQFICSCISAAFIESDIDKIINIGLSNIPSNSKYANMVKDIVSFYKKNPASWISCQHYIDEHYAGLHIWNHSAHIIMALLYGNSEFTYSMEICLKSAGDTDCNCGNLGTILGVLKGYQGISYDNWIAPLNDVLYCSGTVPYENEVSITQFAAFIIKLYGKFNHCVIPEYIENASKSNYFSFVFPYSYQNMSARMWRDGQACDDKVNRNSLWVSANEVIPPSNSPYALKFWADSVRANDCLRVYRWFNDIGRYYSEEDLTYEPTSCTKIYPGQQISVNVIFLQNTARVNLYLTAYSSREDTTMRCPSPIMPKTGVWCQLKWRLPNINSYYDCINIEIIPTQDSYYENGYDGISMYIDDLKIEGNPNYVIDLSANINMVNNQYHYPLVYNFTVCYGEADEGLDRGHFSYGRDNYIRFYSGWPEHSLTNMKYLFQSIAQRNKLVMAFTGSYISGHYLVFCNMSVIPKGGDPNKYNLDRTLNSSLILFAAKGTIEHYAAGFYGNKIAILKSGEIPGKYIELCTCEYDYDMEAQYIFRVEIESGHITFTVYGMDGSNNDQVIDENRTSTISCSVDDKSVWGCIGFAGTGNGITVYIYGVHSYPRINVSPSMSVSQLETSVFQLHEMEGLETIKRDIPFDNALSASESIPIMDDLSFEGDIQTEGP